MRELCARTLVGVMPIVAREYVPSVPSNGALIGSALAGTGDGMDLPRMLKPTLTAVLRTL